MAPHRLLECLYLATRILPVVLVGVLLVLVQVGAVTDDAQTAGGSAAAMPINSIDLSVQEYPVSQSVLSAQELVHLRPAASSLQRRPVSSLPQLCASAG